MSKRNDLTGKTFGSWTVISFSHKGTGGNAVWLCVCSCGAVKEVLGCHLTSHKSTQCRACSLTKHGMYDTRLYSIWRGMKQRTGNPKHTKYSFYGGRGIKVCKEWQKFEPFMEWALTNGYADDLTIDRIDNDKGYSPDNCRWVTWDIQVLNKR